MAWDFDSNLFYFSNIIVVRFSGLPGHQEKDWVSFINLVI